MKEYSRKLLDKALDAIEGAELLVDMGKSDIGAGRAYYAMFYVAEALLNEEDMQFGKHSAVHAAYGEHQSIIAGCWTLLINGLLEIMESTQALRKTLPRT
jgi:uncharacterized protein (UPF0332 family)